MDELEMLSCKKSISFPIRQNMKKREKLEWKSPMEVIHKSEM